MATVTVSVNLYFIEFIVDKTIVLQRQSEENSKGNK